MSLGLDIFGGFALMLAVAGATYTLVAERILRRSLMAAPAETSPARPRVILLKPLHGDEPRLEPDLVSFVAQDYAGEFEVRLGVQDAADPARRVADRLAAAHPGRVRVVVDAQEHGHNRKVSNLINLARAGAGERAPGDDDLILMSDSDIRVAPDYLRRIVTAATAPGVGAVTCYYRGAATSPTGAARLAAMGISYAFLPQVALAVRIGAAEPCMGSTIALRRSTLTAIGGLESVSDVLADDYEIGRRVRALGLHVAIPAFTVEHGCHEVRLRDLWRHELRWQATIRGLDPLGYLGSTITHTLPLALLGVGLTRGAWLSWVVLAAAFASRLWLKRRVDALTHAHAGPWWLLPVRDILSMAVFAAAACARRVDWRGARFHVGRDGALSPVLR